jgi:hypothetical protein
MMTLLEMILSRVLQINLVTQVCLILEVFTKRTSIVQVNYDVTGRFSNERRTDNVNSQVLSDISELEKSTPYKIDQSLSYFYTINEKNILALEMKHLLQDEDPFYVALLENDPTKQ